MSHCSIRNAIKEGGNARTKSYLEPLLLGIQLSSLISAQMNLPFFKQSRISPTAVDAFLLSSPFFSESSIVRR